jgi:hypothetical protein
MNKLSQQRDFGRCVFDELVKNRKTPNLSFWTKREIRVSRPVERPPSSFGVTHSHFLRILHFQMPGERAAAVIILPAAMKERKMNMNARQATAL